MQNFDEIYNFGEEWRGTPNFEVSPVGHFTFVANVTYKSKQRGTEREKCTVQIIRNGIQEGTINIFSKGVLQAETHHLGLSARWQTYKFDSNDGALVVSGDSPKMGGEYTVRLLPNGDKPSFY